ncbi:MAG: replication initiator protein A, partial [Nitrososphaera sp.]
LYRFIQKLGGPDTGPSYIRIKEALERLTGVTITTDGWWDNKTKSHRTKIFHIIDQVAFADPKDKKESSEFTWSRVMFASIRANNIKYLDFGLWRSLQTQIAKRLYRLLDKRFYKAEHVRYNLFELCHEKIGLSRNLKYRSNLIQKLTPAINELKDVEFIRKVGFIADDVTFYRGAGNNSAIRGEMESETQTTARTAPNNRKPRSQQERSSDPKDQLINNLVERGVNRRWASKYLRDAGNEALLRIEALIEYFDQIVKTDRTKVKFPGGFLRTMIEENWTLPPNFQSSRRRKEQEKANEKPISAGPRLDILAEDEAYETWWNAEVDKAISTKSQEAMETLKAQVREEMHRRFSKELD